MGGIRWTCCKAGLLSQHWGSNWLCRFFKMFQQLLAPQYWFYSLSHTPLSQYILKITSPVPSTCASSRCLCGWLHLLWQPICVWAPCVRIPKWHTGSKRLQSAQLMGQNGKIICEELPLLSRMWVLLYKSLYQLNQTCLELQCNGEVDDIPRRKNGDQKNQ